MNKINFRNQEFIPAHRLKSTVHHGREDVEQELEADGHIVPSGSEHKDISVVTQLNFSFLFSQKNSVTHP